MPAATVIAILARDSLRVPIDAAVRGIKIFRRERGNAVPRGGIAGRGPSRVLGPDRFSRRRCDVLGVAAVPGVCGRPEASGHLVENAAAGEFHQFRAGRIVTLPQPEPGLWRVRLSGHGMGFLVVQAKSDASIGRVEFVRERRKARTRRAFSDARAAARRRSAIARNRNQRDRERRARPARHVSVRTSRRIPAARIVVQRRRS